MCHLIDLFAVHSTWLWCTLVCAFVSLCQFVHVQILVMYGMLTNHVLYSRMLVCTVHVCMHVHVVSYTLLVVYNNQSLLY